MMDDEMKKSLVYSQSFVIVICLSSSTRIFCGYLLWL